MHGRKRTLIAIAALAALLPFGMVTAEARATTDVPTASVGGSTPIDAAIDAAVQKQVAAANLTAAGALVYREQLQIQYQSLSAAERQKILSAVRQANTATGLIDVAALLATATKAEAEQALAEVKAAAAKPSASGMQPKLGLSSADRVFISTVGPCRVADSRNGPGQLQPFTGRQIYAMDSGSGYSWALDQGGTGTSSTGNCIGSAFNFGLLPDSVVAIVTVVNTLSTGALQAWNGGTVLSGGAVVVWNAGDRATNTTVIPTDRSIAAFPGSGFKRDLAVYNNSFAPVDYVIDVVGYFIQNTATALECTTLTSAAFPLPANSFDSGSSPACAAGFTRVVTTCFPSDFFVGQVGVSGNTCFMRSETASATSYTATSVCCRVPGR